MGSGSEHRLLSGLAYCWAGCGVFSRLGPCALKGRGQPPGGTRRRQGWGPGDGETRCPVGQGLPRQPSGLGPLGRDHDRGGGVGLGVPLPLRAPLCQAGRDCRATGWLRESGWARSRGAGMVLGGVRRPQTLVELRLHGGRREEHRTLCGSPSPGPAGPGPSLRQRSGRGTGGGAGRRRGKET